MILSQVPRISYILGEAAPLLRQRLELGLIIVITLLSLVVLSLWLLWLLFSPLPSLLLVSLLVLLLGLDGRAHRVGGPGHLRVRLHVVREVHVDVLSTLRETQTQRPVVILLLLLLWLVVVVAVVVVVLSMSMV